MPRRLKHSGIEWIGEIPEDWGVVRGKSLFRQRSEKGNSKKLQLLSPTQKYGVILQEDYERLTGQTAVKLNEKTDLNLLKTIHKGDFCISLRSFQGGFEYSDLEGVVSPAYQVFYPYKPIGHGYYRYLFKTQGFISEMNSFAMSLRDGKNISFDDFGKSYIPLPPLPEQERIAAYLDEKCTKIDALVANSKARLEVLDEYRQALIAKAVTKGLDEGVALKKSGIEWIGEIPEGWGVVRIDSAYTPRNVKVNDRDFRPLSVTKNGIIPQIETAAKTDAHDARKLVKVNDFVINSRSDRRGSCGISNYEGSVSLINTVLKCKLNSCPEFYNWLFHTVQFGDEFYKWGHGIVDDLWTTNWNDMRKISIPYPPLPEQERIAAYLDEKCSKIDALKESLSQQVEELGKYKQSLIFEYVTGKREVPACFGGEDGNE